MVAAGAYLWELRELRRMSRDEVAAQIRAQTGEGTNDVQVMRIEKGQPTNPAVFAAFCRAIDGDWGKVWSLLLDRDSGDEAGRKAAHDWFDKLPADPDERERRRQYAVDLIDALLADSDRLNKLIGYGRRLLEERQELPETP